MENQTRCNGYSVHHYRHGNYQMQSRNANNGQLLATESDNKRTSSICSYWKSASAVKSFPIRHSNNYNNQRQTGILSAAEPHINSIIGSKLQKQSKVSVKSKSSAKMPIIPQQQRSSSPHSKNDVKYYQKYWFSASLEKLQMSGGCKRRADRLEVTRRDYLQQLYQMVRGNVGGLIAAGDSNTEKTRLPTKKCRTVRSKTFTSAVNGRQCEVNGCNEVPLPCTHHCSLHIMDNANQVLFANCSAKFAEHQQCSVPVVDILHELPLCGEHARKRDTYKLYRDCMKHQPCTNNSCTTNSTTLSGGNRRLKPTVAKVRSPKKRKSPMSHLPLPALPSPDDHLLMSTLVPTASSDLISIDVCGGSGGGTCTMESCYSCDGTSVGNSIESPVVELEDIEIVDNVLDLNGTVLDDHDVLETQATHALLEEADISTVLSTIQVDEFSDLFAVNRNGDYEPSREETEELEKALAAVDNDVKSLEKLTQSQGLLDAFLDEQVMAESLVPLPDVFHPNGSFLNDGIVAHGTAVSSFL